MAQVRNIDGVQNTPALRINVDFPFDGSRGSPSSVSVAGIRSGRFVVTWADQTSCAGSRIFSQIVYSTTGKLLGPNIQVSSNRGITDQDHLSPTVTNLKDDGYVIGWTQQGKYLLNSSKISN
jgi:hypothetical protein